MPWCMPTEVRGQLMRVGSLLHMGVRNETQGHQVRPLYSKPNIDTVPNAGSVHSGGFKYPPVGQPMLKLSTY